MKFLRAVLEFHEAQRVVTKPSDRVRDQRVNERHVPTVTPEHGLDAAINTLDRDVDAVVARMKEIEGIPAAGGGSYVATAGIDSPRAQDLVAKLDGIIRKVTRYELIWEAANPDLVESDADEAEPESDETESGE